MRNVKTVAAASALLGGLATFVLGTPRPQYFEREIVREIPARLPEIDARPIGERSIRDLHRSHNVSAGQTEQIAYHSGLVVTAVAPALLADAVPQLVQAKAKTPTILGLYNKDSAVDGNKIKSDTPKTNVTKLFVNVQFAEDDDNVPKGVLTLSIGKGGSVRELSRGIAAKSKQVQLLEFDVSALEMKQAEDVVVSWDPDGDTETRSVSSESAKAWIDNVPPRIVAIKLVGETGGVSVLELQFANNDLKSEPIVKENFPVHRTGGHHTFDTAHNEVTLLGRAPDSFVVRFNLGSLVTDLYQVAVKDDEKNAITDQHGNALTAPFKFTFNSMPEGSPGPHVPFPEFVRRKERQPQEVFNPGDKVETRVARLYYIRDGHRVAQIINRNVKQYNQAGVTGAKIDAKSARETAEQRTKERQIKERDAIRSAESSREVERKLASARQQLEQTRAMMAQQSQATTQIAQAKKQYDPDYEANKRTVTAKEAEILKLQTAISDLTSQIQTQQKTSDEKSVSIESLQAQLDNPPPDAAVEKLKADKKAAEDKQGIATLLVKRQTDRKSRLANELVSSPNDAVLAQQIRDLDAEIKRQRMSIDEQDLEIAQLEYKIANPPKPTTETDLKTAKAAKVAADKQITKLASQKSSAVAQLRTIQDEFDTAKKKVAAAEANVADNPNALTQDQFKSEIKRLVGTVADLEQDIAQKRQAEQLKQESSEQAQEQEDRARENQFRAEVAAGTIDPDTYVPGDVKSEDPVTQVSVSVIGEGVLQLRGPIRGINKIRTMINQIDSPLGQVKVGIFTIQVNGEHGDRMEKVATRIEGHIDLSRFLTNQSLGYLRRAIQEVAGAVVANVDAQFPSQYRQIDRDRKYLYGFFGRDFIDELYEMDSEFLHTENKLLSLHGMDTVSQSQACFIMALTKNDVRQQILDRFRCLVECELPQAEWDYRKTSSLLPCKLNSQKEVVKNAFEKYKFRNVHGFFDATVYGPDTMTPMQREFIRLSQIFKSQMVAELELKQRVIERGLIEDSANDEVARAQALESVRQAALERVKSSYRLLVNSEDQSKQIKGELEQLQAEIKQGSTDAIELTALLERLNSMLGKDTKRTEVTFLNLPLLEAGEEPSIDYDGKDAVQNLIRLRYAALVTAQKSKLLHPLTKEQIRQAWDKFERTKDITKSSVTKTYGKTVTIAESIREDVENANYQRKLLDRLVTGIDDPRTPRQDVEATWRKLIKDWEEYNGRFPICLERLRDLSKSLFALYNEPERQIALSESIAHRVRRDLDHRKLLEILIDEQEEKYIELVEGTRSHIAQIDNYLKRLAIALEDDFKVQFYDPGFAGVRAASREWDVNLGQIERTTILTNNRQFAKVMPQATMEFDLPKRAPMIVEGMNGARALVQEYGTLLQDPTFLSLSGMMSGSPTASGVAPGTPTPGLPNQGLRTAAVRNVLPGQSNDSAEQLMSQSSGPDRKFGAALEGLIPDPAVYKFETGTGFEIRPVIQPDGHSVIYDFDYMYTTNVREPVRADEKHLGRVKRHFIHTQVQTSSFELREISRYQVALKASRTSRGVPLLEDIPGAGVLFRPLPSDESSLQQNIILAQSTVYPTMFDLMGLRWSKYVVDLDHLSLRDLEHVTRGREQSIHDFTFDEASTRVDEFLDIQNKQPEHYRPDLYHQQRQASPNHPGGYQYKTKKEPYEDPRNRNFMVPDRRPEEYRVPSYDSLRRNPIDNELHQMPTPGGQPEDINLQIIPPEPVPLQGSSTRSRLNSVPNGPARKSTWIQKSKSLDAEVQPASFEQSTTTPKAISDDVSGHTRVSSSAAQPALPTPPKKKSWLSNLKPSLSK